MNKENILSSWQKNATSWINSIENNEIKSRELATNQAILNAIFSVNPKTVLDVGCGEGWLTRMMCENGINATGIDGVNALVERAKQYGLGKYFTLNYDEIRNGDAHVLDIYDAIIFNYALFEKEEVAPLMIQLKNHISENGKLIIQTISDKNKLFSQRPEDGWMTEDWKGLSTEYNSSFKWYYRSEQEWLDLFAATGFKFLQKKEVIVPGTKEPLSVIYTVKKK